MTTPALYINPNAPKLIRDFFDHLFPDVQRVSAMYFQELTGGFTDQEPAIGDYAVVIIDEEGQMSAFLNPPFDDRNDGGAHG